jgi:type IV secretion system protein VirD4
VFETTSQAMDSDRSGLTYAEHHSGRALLTPDEVRNLPQSRELLFLAGMRPILATKLRYYADREFVGLFV